MTKATSWKRPGLHTVTPRLIFKDARKAIEFYEAAFGAKKNMVSLAPDGKSVMHAEISIGDSVIFLCDEVPHMDCIAGNTNLAISVENVDASFKQAVDAGCTVKMPVTDMFWGDRFSAVKDPFGNSWEISTHIEDLTQSEIEQRRAKRSNKMASAKC